MSGDRSSITRVFGEPHGGRFASLEGYRAIAALAVVVFHLRNEFVHRPIGATADPIDNFGNFGVATFFVLSGFLLFRPHSAEMLGGAPAGSTGRFLLRRFLRIYPGYWLALAGWAVFATEQARLGTAPVKAFFLLSTDLSGLGVAWTLAIELRFYVALAVLRVILTPIARRLGSRSAVLRLQLALLVSMYLVALCFRVYIVGHPLGRALQGGSLWNYLDWFVVGMALALASAWSAQGGRLPAALVGLADREWAAFLCAAACFGAIVLVMPGPMSLTVDEPTVPYLFRFALQAPAAGLFLLPAVLGNRDQWLQRTLRRPWPAAIGTVSYGLYLWHKTVLDVLVRHVHDVSLMGLLACLVVLLVVSVAIATASYRLLERPALALCPAEPARPRGVLVGVAS